MKLNKNIISLLKRKVFNFEINNVNFNVNNNNSVDVAKFIIELNKIGYTLDSKTFDLMSKLSNEYLTQLYNDVVEIVRMYTTNKYYEPTYKNFPDSVKNISQEEFVLNAIVYYITNGTIKPEEQTIVENTFKIELNDNLKVISSTLNDNSIEIFEDIIYSGTSTSEIDNKIIEYFLNKKYVYDINKVTFNETAANIVKYNIVNGNIIRGNNPELVLMAWYMISGGTSLISNNKKIKLIKLNKEQLRNINLFLTSFNEDILSEVFKRNREQWLRALYYLKPIPLYKTLFNITNLLRNEPKKLVTFNSKIEKAIKEKDLNLILSLLKDKQGVFTRRLLNLIEIFGPSIVDNWLQTNPTTTQLVTIHNLIITRSAYTKYNVNYSINGVSYTHPQKEKKLLDMNLVFNVTNKIYRALENKKFKKTNGKKVYVAKELNYRLINKNNRTDSNKFDSNFTGDKINLEDKYYRFYTHWSNKDGRTDIDLSGMLINNDNSITKIGWNGYGSTGAVTYSGDNTGHNDYNAEYLDVDLDMLSKDNKYLIINNVIYANRKGVKKFKDFSDKVLCGYLGFNKQPSNDGNLWLPKNTKDCNSLNMNSRSNAMYAIDLKSKQLVFLDMSMGESNVIGVNETMTMLNLLDIFFSKRQYITQGILLNISCDTTENIEEADIIFDKESNDLFNSTINEEINAKLRDIQRT